MNDLKLYVWDFGWQGCSILTASSMTEAKKKALPVLIDGNDFRFMDRGVTWTPDLTIDDIIEPEEYLIDHNFYFANIGDQ